MMTDRYAVFGNPISHSKSPFIHGEFAKQTAENIRYEAILSPVEEFPEQIRQFFATGGKGANVTVPFKEQAYRLCDELSTAAEAAKAVNTLTKLADGRIRGDNTDGYGLVTDLATAIAIAGKRVLLLGAGGAAKGCLQPLIDAGVSSIVVVNRTYEKAQLLASASGHVSVVALRLSELTTSYDIVINATSASLQNDMLAIPAAVISPTTLCYDMMYGAETTVFNRWCQAQGASKVLDGLGMLLGQAARSFEIWRGVRPDYLPVLQQLRRALQSAAVAKS